MQVQYPTEEEIVDTGASINFVAEDEAIVFCYTVHGACGTGKTWNLEKGDASFGVDDASKITCVC